MKNEPNQYVGKLSVCVWGGGGGRGEYTEVHATRPHPPETAQQRFPSSLGDQRLLLPDPNLSDAESSEHDREERSEEVQERDRPIVHQDRTHVENCGEHPEHHRLTVPERKSSQVPALLPIHDRSGNGLCAKERGRGGGHKKEKKKGNENQGIVDGQRGGGGGGGENNNRQKLYVEN